MGIISVMAGFAVMGVKSAQAKARDARRKSDIKQYQTALEAYANKNNGFYPTISGTDAAVQLCPQLAMPSCPTNPVGNPYGYSSNGGGGASATRYVLWTYLERRRDNQDVVWVICSDGRVGTVPQSGFSVSNGNCPNPTAE